MPFGFRCIYTFTAPETCQEISSSDNRFLCSRDLMLVPESSVNLLYLICTSIMEYFDNYLNYNLNLSMEQFPNDFRMQIMCAVLGGISDSSSSPEA